MIWFEFDSFQFEVETRILRKAGQQVPLAPKAADLLLLFLDNPGKLLSNDELKHRVWRGVAVVESNIHFQLSIVRQVLGQRMNGEPYIENLPKRGYRFVAPVQRRGADRVEIATSQTPAQPVTSKNRSLAVDTLNAFPLRRGPLAIRQWAAFASLGAVLALALTSMPGYRATAPPRVWVTRYTPLTSDGHEKADVQNLLSDGVRIYFEEKVSKGRTLSAVAVSGGGTGQIPLPEGWVNIYDLAPLTSEVLAGYLASDRRGVELWVVPLLGGPRRRVGDLRVTDAKWSPNGRQVAVSLNDELYIANPDGTQRRKIAQIAGKIYSPRWSPDGKTIRFTVMSIQNTLLNSIWEVGEDGSNLHELLTGWNNPPNECCGVWTPDGSSFIFQSTRAGRIDLWALSERRGIFKGGGSESPVRLTSGHEGYSSPAVSSDGKQVFAVGSEKRGELVRYDLRSRQFVPFLGGIAATWVSFSRSERSVAYINYKDLTVWRANSDGSEKSQVTFSPFEADGLSWSPDDKWLALRGRTPGKPWNIYLVPSSGGNAEALIPDGTEQAIPTWSADSRRIAFGDVPRIHGKESGKEDIHILDLSDRGLSELPGSRGFWTARWSPDGRYISATTIDGQRLMLYDFKTKKWRSTEAESVDNPTWSRDSKYIYYDTEGPVRNLRRVCVANGHVDQLVNLNAHPNLAWWWSGVTPDNSPLIVRDVGSTEIYALMLESR
jgi:Tol biopolymer transport system component/DNA-binding winged helix-turn-helix (wHTH) protein